MNSSEWKLKERNSRRRLSRLHRLVASTLFTSWTTRCGKEPTSSLLDWTSGLVADLSWVLDRKLTEEGTPYVELSLDQLEHQIGIGRLQVIELLIDLQAALERELKSTRTEPYFVLWNTSKSTHPLPLKEMAATPRLMQ